jgi:hypothetical protein
MFFLSTYACILPAQTAHRPASDQSCYRFRYYPSYLLLPPRTPWLSLIQQPARYGGVLIPQLGVIGLDLRAFFSNASVSLFLSSLGTSSAANSSSTFSASTSGGDMYC